ASPPLAVSAWIGSYPQPRSASPSDHRIIFSSSTTRIFSLWAFRISGLFHFKVELKQRHTDYKRLLLQRLHVIKESFGLFGSNSLLLKSRHVGWLLCLLAFENDLKMLFVGPGRIKLFLRFCTVAGKAFRFVGGSRIKIIS